MTISLIFVSGFLAFVCGFVMCKRAEGEGGGEEMGSDILAAKMWPPAAHQVWPLPFSLCHHKEVAPAP